MKPNTHYQTIAATYSELIAEENLRYPWVPLGDFLNDWYLYHSDERARLLEESIAIPSMPSTIERRWAAFCAATTEYFAEQAQLAVPAWALDPSYSLQIPWHFDGTSPEKTPEPFRKRALFCSSTIFANKYVDDTHLRHRLLEQQYREEAQYYARQTLSSEWSILCVEKDGRSGMGESLEAKTTLLFRVDVSHSYRQHSTSLYIAHSRLDDHWSVLTETEMQQRYHAS